MTPEQAQAMQDRVVAGMARAKAKASEVSKKPADKKLASEDLEQYRRETSGRVTITPANAPAKDYGFKCHVIGYDDPMYFFESETKTQQAVVSWFKITYPKIYESGAFFAVPNQGKRSRATASRMKAEGMFPGVSDLILMEPRGGYFGMVLEMKHGDGALSKDQKKWLEARRESGYYVAACWTYEHATNEFSNYLKLK